MTGPQVDEARFAETQHTVKVSALRGRPLDDDRCATCYYYLDPTDDISFCWHEKLQILVGDNWWCHFWEMRDDD
jgi:hypothetical protein